MSSSQMASSGATGGTQGVTNNAISEGDWNIAAATSSSAGGMNKTFMYVALGAAAILLWRNRKA
jgi:hypothetical protein